jgi:hypothetical protein
MRALHPAQLLRSPRTWLLVLGLLTLIALPIGLSLRLEESTVDLLPRSSPAAQSFKRFTRGLVAGQELIILVVCEDPARLLSFADQYAAALEKLPDAGQITYRVSQRSIGYLREHLLLLLNDDELDELSRRLQPEALSAQVRRLRGLLTAPGGGAMAPLVTADPLDLLPLISRRLSSGLPVDAQSGYFRTADGKALLIKARPGFDPMADWQRDRRLLDDAGRLAVSLGARVAGGDRILADATPTVAFTGAYAFPPYWHDWMEHDMTRSTVLSVGSVLLLFALFFRALRILPVVLLPLCVAGLWTAAAARLLFGTVNGISLAFGTILVAIGIDLPIQLYNRMREEMLRLPSDAAPGVDARAAVRVTIDALAGPSIVATLGPAAVFLCCCFSDYRGLSELGILAALGLCLNCLAMLSLFPCLLMVLPVWLWHSAATTHADRRRAERAARGEGGLLWFGRLCGRRPGLLLAGAAALLLLSLPAALRLSFEEHLLSMVPQKMPPAVAQDEIARRFGDRQRFLGVVLEDRDPDRAMWRADLWVREAERLRQAGLLRGYEALGSLVPSVRTQADRRARLAKMDLPGAAARLRQALEEAGFDPAPFSGFLQLLQQGPGGALTPDGLLRTELAFLVQSHLADTAEGRLMAVYLFAPADQPIEPLLARLAGISGGEAGGALTGQPVLERELLAIVKRDAVVVTASSVALVLLLLCVYYRRPRPIGAVLLPLLLAWVLFAAAMTLFGFPLNLYNLLAIPLCIGYGIDDHVFLVHRHLATPPGERDPGQVLSATGRAIVLTSLSTMAGFAGLGVARFSGLRLLGLSGALAVLLCLFVAFAVLPALLALIYPRSRSAEPA